MTDSQKFQKFLDEVQYSRSGLKRYEWIFGETFLSTGGIETTKKVLSQVSINNGSHILDIGSGIGGHSFIMAELFQATVHGIDLSKNMMEIAEKHLEKRPHLKDRIKFEIKDCTKCEFPENSFDLVYCRDTLLHIEPKVELFKNIRKWLKPGGYVLFTDYVRGEDSKKYSDEFKQYLNQRSYHMSTLSDYRSILVQSGFKDINVKDWNVEFKEALQMELDKLRNSKDEFLGAFSQKDFDDLESGWLSKIKRVSQNNQGWVLGYAKK